MASKKFEKGSEEWGMFIELWTISQKYAIPEPTEEFWSKFIEEGKEYVSKYEKFDGQLADDWIVAWNKHLERMQNL